MRPGVIIDGITGSRSCSRFFGYDFSTSAVDRLKSYFSKVGTYEVPRDVYSNSTYITELEDALAQLTGHESGLYFPTGAMAQLVACRIWSEQTKLPSIAMHPMCQLAINENNAYSAVHQLHAEIVGDENKILSECDVKDLYSVSVLIHELPMRQLGGLLPSISSLGAIKETMHRRGIKMHLDGARIFEASAAYGREISEISAYFDSVYISLYKGMGLFSGSVLTGPADFIGEARVWRKRLGGELNEITPLILGWREALDHCLTSVDDWIKDAQNFAEQIRSFDHLGTMVDKIETNILHVRFDAPAEIVIDARDEIKAKFNIWTFGSFVPVDNGEACFAEIEVRDPISKISIDERRTVLATFNNAIAKYKIETS